MGAFCLLSTPALAATGQITGAVTDEATAQPIDGVSVCAFVVGTEINACDETNASGEYAVTDLPANSFYRVEFNGEPEYEIEYYDDKPSWVKSTAVAVVAGGVTAGIDAELTAIAGNADALNVPPSGSAPSFVGPVIAPMDPPVGGQPASSARQRPCPKRKRARIAKGKKSRCLHGGANRPRSAH
jgi:hypothetical protein